MFNLRNHNAAYCPTRSNGPLVIAINLDEDNNQDYPVNLSGQIGSWTLDGKYVISAPNPSVFPYTQEWYDKLKVIYPDLKPYVADYHSVIKSILANAKTVVCRKSYVNHAEAIKSGALVFVDANTQLSKGAYYVVVNPFTLEVCNSDADYFAIPDINIPF